MNKMITWEVISSIKFSLTDLRAILRKNQTKLEMKNFDPPTQIYMEVGPHEGCSKMSIIDVN